MNMWKIVILSILELAICLKAYPEKTGGSQVSGAKIFGAEQIHEIRIQFLQCEAWDSLVQNKFYKDSVHVKKYLQGNVQVDGKMFFSCGVRLKGEASFDHYPGNKKSLKINFGEYIKKQKLDGLKTINLNNSFKDPSFMREKLYLDLLRKEGLPAPRCSYANVYVNGELYGLYLLVEEINKGFLKYNFGNKKGAFFKGEPNSNFNYLGEDALVYMGDYKLKTDRLEDYQEIIRLIKLMNEKQQYNRNSTADLDEFLNVENCLKIFAINSLLMNVDAINLMYPHNFYLYKNEETKQFEWIPYDGNYAFCAFSPNLNLEQAQNLSVFHITDRFPNPLLRLLFGNKKYREMYRRYLLKMVKNHQLEDQLGVEIDRLAIKIRQSVYQDPMKMYSNDEFETNLNSSIGDVLDPGAFEPGLKEFIKNRFAAVRQELKAKK